MTQFEDYSIEDLELNLAKLANQWRKQHSEGRLQAAEATVREYHSMFARLWALGWDGEGLLPDSELPDDLMPEYYLKRWREK